MPPPMTANFAAAVTLPPPPIHFPLVEKMTAVTVRAGPSHAPTSASFCFFSVVHSFFQGRRSHSLEVIVGEDNNLGAGGTGGGDL